MIDGYLPILFEADEEDFSGGGNLGYCECISCTITETLNSLEDYQCTMVYPITGPLAYEFTEGRILLVVHQDNWWSVENRETFVIYNTYFDMSAGTITVYAQQQWVYHAKFTAVTAIPVSYDDSGNVVEESIATRANKIGSYAGWYNSDWYVNITVSGFSGTFAYPSTTPPMSLLDAVQNYDYSLLNTCGTGYLSVHRKTVKLASTIGDDNGYIVCYGKNLKQLTVEMNAASSYSAILPYWQKTNNDTGKVTIVTGANNATAGEVINCGTQETAERHILVVDVSSDLKEPEKEESTDSTTTTEEDTEWFPSSDEVRAAGIARMESLCDGKISIIYNAEIAQDPDAIEPEVELGDIVLLQYAPLGINQKMQIVSRTFNVLTRRYESLGIGSVEKSLAQAIKDLKK